MQLIEPTARRVGEALKVEYEADLLRIPSYNIRFGGYYLRRVLDTFGQRVALAAAAYNAGPSAVSRWLESGERLELDVFVARIPYRETRTYVHRVMGNLARYAYLEKGVDGVVDLELRIEKGLRSGPDAY
jgi:soluble lytic murein transglycosylase